MLKNLFYLRQISIAFLAFFWMSSAVGQTLTNRIKDKYSEFVNHPNLKNGHVSFTVLDNKNGEILFESQSHKGMPTASTLKVITAITALDILGPDFQFLTSLYYTGEIDQEGTLHGNIIIEGAGDPTLASDRFDIDEAALLDLWKNSIQSAGIKRIVGTVIGDDRLYNGYQAPGGYSWSDLGNYYGAGVSSLNWRENKIGMDFTAGKIQEEARLVPLANQFDYLTFVNEVTTGTKGSGDNVYGFTGPYSSVIFLRGTYGQDLKKTIELSSPNPAQDAAYALMTVLAKNGIQASQKPSALNPLNENPGLADKKELLHSYLSPKLEDIVYWFNKKSINLYGEALLIAIGKEMGKEAGTYEGAQVLKDYWLRTLSIPKEELKLVDGSGLSQQNRITSDAMAKIMHYAKSQPWFPVFEKSLPLINNMTMKSGTIGGTLGYTGYQTSAQNEDVTFSLLINNYHGGAQAMRQRMFELLNSLK